MCNKLVFQNIFISFIFICLSATTMLAQTGVFTYQGRLTDGAAAANGTYEMRFSLYNALSGPAQVGSTITNSSVTVAGGVFTVQLDFGSAPFATGADRWLEIAVRKAADPPGFIILTPRQQVTSAPLAIRSSSAANADTAATAGNVSGVVAVANGGTGSSTQNFVDLSTNQTVSGNKTFTGTLSGNGSGLTNLNGANIQNNTVNASALASDTFPNNRNLSLLGSLRWDLLGQRVTVGSYPYAVAFDGANIWVANQNSNNVTKLRVSDGAVQGTFAVGANPKGVAFDGANIWVANNGSSSVTKLRASDGACVNGTCTFSIGASPIGIAFDGANIWVTMNSGQVRKLRASDGFNLGAFAVGTTPQAIAFDGESIWVTNFGSSNVTKLRASDGACVATCTFVGFSNPAGVAFDGANIWVESTFSVKKLRASDGVSLGTFPIDSAGGGVVFDGANVWVADSGSSAITKLRASDGVVLGTFPVSGSSIGLAFDGANIWVANLSSNNVTRLPVFP